MCGICPKTFLTGGVQVLEPAWGQGQDLGAHKQMFSVKAGLIEGRRLFDEACEENVSPRIEEISQSGS